MVPAESKRVFALTVLHHNLIKRGRPARPTTIICRVGGDRGGGWGCSFRKSLRLQPRDLPRPIDPLAGILVAGQAGDVADLRAFAVRLDLPIAVGDPFRTEGDA